VEERIDSADVRIPVFASVPSKLDVLQRASKRYIYSRLEACQLDPLTLGPLDRGRLKPLHEVRNLARRCSGGIILGYSQITAEFAKGYIMGTSPEGAAIVLEQTITGYQAPTPWNQLETGILFGLGLPLLVLKQGKISGGIFDEGASDVLAYDMPMPGPCWQETEPNDLGNKSAEQSFDAALGWWRQAVVAHHESQRAGGHE
jgi:hypothetical protein